MIIDFKFKNFMSFANECNFSMLANKDKSHEDFLLSFNNDRISTTRMIYGANASGKSSFIRAMDFFLGFLKNSNFLLESNIIQIIPFKFRDNPYEIPSEFEITFTIKETKYNYSFSCTRTKVINERLDAYYSAKPTNIFERTNTNEYKFTKDIKLLNDLKTKNSDNKLFLVTSATWNYEKTKHVVDYLVNNIIVLYDINLIWKYNLDRIIADGVFDDYKKFCIKLLNDADISINDFTIDTKKLKDIGNDANLITEILRLASKGNEEAMNTVVNSNIYSFYTTHEISTPTGKKNFILNLAEESLGTIQMFMISPLLYYVFKEETTVLVDEIDKSLHPLLVEHIIKLFYNKDINKNNAQLIANTHDTNLLNLDLFRRDEIWFTERHFDTGISEIFPLSDFSPRKDENIEKAYLLGRFGAIPFIKEN